MYRAASVFCLVVRLRARSLCTPGAKTGLSLVTRRTRFNRVQARQNVLTLLDLRNALRVQNASPTGACRPCVAGRDYRFSSITPLSAGVYCTPTAAVATLRVYTSLGTAPDAGGGKNWKCFVVGDSTCCFPDKDVYLQSGPAGALRSATRTPSGRANGACFAF